MWSPRSVRSVVGGLFVWLAVMAAPAHAQADIQKTVRGFLQAWYVDRKSPEELKSYVAQDNGFKVGRLQAEAVAAGQDQVSQLFAGAFTKGATVPESAAPKTLGEMIEYGPAKKQEGIAATNAKKTQTPKQSQPNCAMASPEFAICKPEELPKGAVLPANKPLGSDPVAMYLWHLSQTYKGKLYIVLYSTKGAGLLRETAIQYWIQEGGSWKLAAFQGTNW